MKDFQPSAFDLFFVVVILVGVLIGRKRGISEELLDVLQWIAILLAAAFGYEALGGMAASQLGMPILLANVLSYLLVAGLVTLLFKSVKRAVGEKLVRGDAFGQFEYYLGMLAGAIRFSCITIFCLAMLNAFYSTPAQRAANARMQKENLGSISFPTIPTIQESIFKQSVSGKFIEKKLNPLLIDAVPPGPARPTQNIKQRREKAVNEVINAR